MTTENLQAQVEAVMNVLAPYVDGPPGFASQRWPIFRFDHGLVPSDEQVLALAEQIVTAVRTASGSEPEPDCKFEPGEQVEFLSSGLRGGGWYPAEFVSAGFNGQLRIRPPDLLPGNWIAVPAEHVRKPGKVV